MPIQHRSSRVVVYLALVLTAAVGCGSDDDSDGDDLDVSLGRTTVADDPMTTPMETTLEAVGTGDQAGVSLSADLVVDGPTLRLTYRLENAGDRAVVVADAVAAPQGAAHGPDPTGAWVTASTAGVVTVGKWPIATPPEPGSDTGEPLNLYVVRVEAGAAADGTIEVAWPLQPNHPYLPGDQVPVPLPDPVETLRLCVGVNALTPEIEGAPVIEDDGHSWLAVPMDQLISTPPLCTEPASVG